MTWFFQSLQALVPDGWAGLTAGWTRAQKEHVLQSLTSLVHSVTPQEQLDGARRWGEYEDAVMRAMTGSGSPPAPFAEDWIGKYRVQSHYLSQSCFISERQLFRCARRAARVPAMVLHGTHDWICPPENATRLLRFMPHATLRWIENGTHTLSDPSVSAALRRAIHDMQHDKE